MPEKIDMLKSNKADYAQPKKPILLNIGPAQFMIIDCEGEPGGEAFQAAMDALYGGAFTVKMNSKKQGRDYTVCKLEALWTSLDDWIYSMMIRTPDFITGQDLKEAQQTLETKGKAPRAGDLRLEFIDEGQCVQMLHVGPYDQEGDTVKIMRDFAEGQGLELHGKHHEIYISDPRRVPPERLKTILRNPAR